MDHLEPVRKRVREGPIGPAPAPWVQAGTWAVGGLIEVGFGRETDLLLVVSWQGRAVFDESRATTSPRTTRGTTISVCLPAASGLSRTKRFFSPDCTEAGSQATHEMVGGPSRSGPSALPRLDAAAVKSAPVLGMLSTLAHTDDPDCAEQVLETLEALASWDDDADGRLADMLGAALPAAVRARMEELMRTGKYEYQSDFAKKYFALGCEQGLVTGEARALLLVLRSRAVDVPAEAARRIEEERDGARLEVWIRRAVTATTIDDVFADE